MHPISVAKHLHMLDTPSLVRFGAFLAENCPADQMQTAVFAFSISDGFPQRYGEGFFLTLLRKADTSNIDKVL